MTVPAGPPTEGGTALISLVDNRIRLDELDTPTHHIDLLRIDGRFWRLVETPRGTTTYTRWWDYPAGDPVTVITAAYEWHRENGCSADTEPCGWVTRSADCR